MAFKLICFNDGVYREKEDINFQDYYLTNMESFPIVLSETGSMLSLKDFFILNNKLVVNDYNNFSSTYPVKQSHLKDIIVKAKPINALDFIIKGEI